MKTKADRIAAAIEDAEEIRDTPPRDRIILPNDSFSFARSAHSVFTKLATTGRYFVRGGVVVELASDGDHGKTLNIVTSAALRSRLDREAGRVMAYVRLKGGGLALREKRCSDSNADALLATIEATELLPPIRLVTRAPIIVAGDGGHPTVLVPGYHPVAGGVLVTGNVTAPQIDLSQAVRALRDLVADFDFTGSGDESRAVAAMITPALKMGRWLNRATPIDIAESDCSQAGKGYLQKTTRAIYGETAHLVTRRVGGVGSLDESISTALMSGRPFVALDNLRGRIDSQFLEAILTWPERVPVRIPHRGEVPVDVRAVSFALTSNGIDATRDFVNRASITRITKRPKDYVFRVWPEGDVLAHLEARWAYYLGCVFAVVSTWAEKGQPRLAMTETGFHDFREWAGVLGWIVQRLFGLGPLLQDHQATQARGCNPALGWLRKVCWAAASAKKLEMLSASAIADLCDQADITLPGLEPSAAEDQRQKHVGKLLGRCFQDATGSSIVMIDAFIVNRVETTEHDATHRCDRKVRRYRIEKVSPLPRVPHEATGI